MSQSLDTAHTIPEGTRNVCAEMVRSLPEGLMGRNRLRHVARAVQQGSLEKRRRLRRFVDRLCRRAVDVGASDVDVGGATSDGQAWYRIDGQKRRHEEMEPVRAIETDAYILSLVDQQEAEELFEVGAVEFSHCLTPQGSDEGRRFRASVYVESNHVALNLRVVPDDIRPLESLGLHPQIQNEMLFQHVRDGLTLVTGVTGSGKSTTLDAIVDANNRDVPGHIVVIADPVEYMHESKRCLVRHREVGRDVATYKDGIVQALRQDPDVVVIGELRDPETITAALEVTDSGHRVFSTLHTPSAIETIDRIVAEVPVAEQPRVRARLADVLQCIVSQKLVPSPDGGRVLAKEVCRIDSSVRAAIKNDNVGEVYQMMWQGQEAGQITLEQDLHRLVRKNEIAKDTAIDFANNKRRLRRLL